MPPADKLLVQKVLRKNPVIISAKNEAELLKAIENKSKVIFLLFGSICNLQQNIHLAKERGKMVFVHADRIEGSTPHKAFVDFIQNISEVDGLISTHPRLLNYAKERGLISILRVFLLDSMAVSNSLKSIAECQPDLVEVLPGIATQGFKLIQDEYNGPLIAGGLIKSAEDVLAALTAGAIGISSSNQDLTKINRLIQEQVKSNSPQ
ncbi:MAG: glycerol-3-phosphate responsive antiterminator [Eubacteriales bacterium]|nr:glycerol-3-phosphate responsive antiterminator [Eubacteriales bacterium]